MREIYDALLDLKKIAKLKWNNPPYLFQFFNVFGYHQSKTSCVKGMARIFNAFIEGMNGRPRLPRFLVFIMDKDFIQNINFFGFGATRVMEIVLTWLVKEVNKCIKRRKTDLFNVKPGAISLDQTKIVWVKMIKRPYGGMSEFDQVFALRNRFNNAIDNVLQDTKPINYVLSIQVDEHDFYPNGELTEQEQRAYWKEVNDCLALFDQDKINLKPKGLKDNNPGNRTANDQRKLPTPPRKGKGNNRFY